MRIKYSLTLFCLIFSFYCSKAQNYPVQVTSILTPPFSGYLPDYSATGNTNFRIILLFKDFTKPSYQVKLKFKLNGQNILIENKNFFFAGPFTLIPGVPLEISGSDLAQMLNSNNLNFSGISKQQYQSAKVLPEGFYQICVTAYDFNNPSTIQVSNEGCTSGWMMLNDPPFLNMPFCGSTQPVTNPQNIFFQWTAMNLASPNSAFNTQYEFSLYEIRPKGANPNNILQTLPPIYQTTTNLMSLNYGITEPVLNLGMDYVWRVKATDNSGRDLFKNNGYSQYCTFTYGSMSQFIDSTQLALVLQGTPISHRMLKCFWDTLNVYKNYKLYYRKQGGANWFCNSNISRNYDYVSDLEPESTYQLYVKGLLLDNSEGPASNTITISTPKKTDYVCGQGNSTPTGNFKPLLLATIGQTWDVGQFEMEVTALKNNTSPNGVYSGFGEVRISFLGKLNVRFDNIMVNEQQRVIAGQVNVVTKGIGKWLASFKYPPGWNIADSVKVNGSIQSATTTPEGEILVNGQPVGNSGGNTIISGSGNTVVYVSANGSVTIEDFPKEDPVGDIHGLNDSLSTIAFENTPQSIYSWDAHEIKSLTAGDAYESLQYGADGYSVGWKLLITGTADIIGAQVKPGLLAIDSSKVKFKRSDGTLLSHTITANNYYKINLNGRLNLFSDALWAFARKKNSLDTTYYPIGKINLVSVDKKIKTLVLVPVNGTGNNLSAASMQEQLNAIYKKAGVEINVRMDSNLVVNDYHPDSLLIVSRSRLNTTYGSDLKRIINAYKTRNPVFDNETSCIFLCHKATNNEHGYMALNKRYGFLFLFNNNEPAHTAAHEFGHGNLVLKHTFEHGNGGQSLNLMDYGGGDLFHHAQWLNIHDPSTLDNLLSTLVQDEEDGAKIDFTKAIVEILTGIRKAYKNSESFNLGPYRTNMSTGLITLQGISYDYIHIITLPQYGHVITPRNAISQSTFNASYPYNQNNIKPCIDIQGKFKIFVPENRIYSMINFIKQAMHVKNLILFANGYRPIINFNGDPNNHLEYDDTQNNIDYYDSRSYWNNIDRMFINKIGSFNSYYVDGHHKVETSNHLTVGAYLAGNLHSDLIRENCKNIHAAMPNHDCLTTSFLHTTPNVAGFLKREASGVVAANNLHGKIVNGDIPFDFNKDSIDVVAHSMGYAYSVGIIKRLKELDYNFRTYYILAPENACSGGVNLNDFREVWQYGTDEAKTPPYLQDGVAPQCGVPNLINNGEKTKGRAFIPDNYWPKGYLDSHTVKNYDWIFSKQPNENGYVKTRN